MVNLNTPFVLFSICIVLLLGVVVAAYPDDAFAVTPMPEGEAYYLRLSEELAGDLQASLGPQLMAAMKLGGPERAIEVCQQVAQALTDQAARLDEGITVSRTGPRVRNPENAPDALSQSVMRSWQMRLASAEPIGPVLDQADASIIVHRPIQTAALCLQCHGSNEQIDKSTLARIRELYPEDAATGFAEGDLRGAFRVEFSKQQAF